MSFNTILSSEVAEAAAAQPQQQPDNTNNDGLID